VISKGSFLYYLIALSLFIFLKYGFTLANNDDLAFLLKPTNYLISLITDSNATYVSENGFIHHQLNIIIDRSCSGFNLWLISYMMLTFLGLKYFKTNYQKILVIPVALSIAYILTIIANTSRIFASIIIQNQATNFQFISSSILHESIGIITNLSFLILVYFLVNKFLYKMKPL